MCKRYSCDLSDEQWALVEPLIPPERPGGHRHRTPDLRAVLDAILYVGRSACTGRMIVRPRDLPGDFPSWQTAYHYFARWRDDGALGQVYDVLHRRWRTSVGAGADAERGRTGLAERAGGAGGRRAGPRHAQVHRRAVEPDGRSADLRGDDVAAAQTARSFLNRLSHIAVPLTGFAGIAGTAGPRVHELLDGPLAPFANIPGASALATAAPDGAAPDGAARADSRRDPRPARMLAASALTLTAPAAGSPAFVDSTLTVEVALSDTTGLQDVAVFF